MSMLAQLQQDIKSAVQTVYDYSIPDNQVIISPTKKEFEGAYTFVVFPLVKALKSNPVEIGNSLGAHLKEQSDIITDFNVVKGFLNLSLSDSFWRAVLDEVRNESHGQLPNKGKKFMVEYASPNTNKPLHLGHIRNILLGWSMGQIAAANGYELIKTQVINDRGIAVCKSMWAWQQMGEGKTPSSENVKGDHFVGKFYVAFEQEFQKEYKVWQATPEAASVYKEHGKDKDELSFFKSFKNKYFNEYSKIGKETKEMLLRWEAGDEETVALWKKMNGWVYEGFDKTYAALGVDFDYNNYESETYLLGKDFVQQGLKDGVFYQKEDGSVWADLEDAKMDHKIVLRSDGTSVYVTQDLGTAHLRYENYNMDHLVYVVADEQDYHFKVLFEILKRLGEPYAENLHHLSYGMVDLPSGKMKSREGTVVDADDLVKEVIDEARQGAAERGGLEGLSEEEREDIFRKVGLAALKYFIIKVNPKKRMTFDPKESVDMQGQTGPYIQNAYVRIQSIFRKSEQESFQVPAKLDEAVHPLEKELLLQLQTYPEVISEAFGKYDPSHVANYCYNLAKTFHRFYHDCRILGAENEATKQLRLALSQAVGVNLKKAMSLLGIEMPAYM